MFALVITVVVIFLLLALNEWWWRERIHGEISRKFVHITVGSFVAFWPLFLTWRQIELLSAAFVVAVMVSQKFNIFKAIHSVQRPTWGELYFGLSVGVIAFMTHSPAIYAVALLHMSLADGLAAITGVKYGASQAYHIFGTRKSIVGSTTFFAVSIVLLASYCINQNEAFTAWFVLVALGAALLENVAVRGLDNLLIPMYLAWFLSTVD
jgi:dolichol kinase